MAEDLQRYRHPHFVVFYNGEGGTAGGSGACLSDAFEKLTDEPNLELKCMCTI